MSRVTTYEETVEERKMKRNIERGMRDTLQTQVDRDLGRGAQPSADVQDRLKKSETRLQEAEASLLAAEEALALLRMIPAGTKPIRRGP